MANSLVGCRIAACKKWQLRGVTAIELLVVIAVIGVLTGIAAPSMVSMLDNTTQKAAVSQLANDLNFARGEAVKRNARVLICAKNSLGTDCASTTQNWAKGWVICVDTSNDATDNCDAGTNSNPNPFVVRDALSPKLTLNANNGAAIYVVRFNANSTQGQGTSAATFTLNGNWSGAVSKSVGVAISGNIRSY
jgi:type IV fimbrial biogenesis protein FimT